MSKKCTAKYEYKPKTQSQRTMFKSSFLIGLMFFSQLNSATSFIDASQVYGHTNEEAAKLRCNKGGKLNSETINGQEFNAQQKRDTKICLGRDNVNVCFEHGIITTRVRYKQYGST